MKICEECKRMTFIPRELKKCADCCAKLLGIFQKDAYDFAMTTGKHPGAFPEEFKKFREDRKANGNNNS